MHTYKVEVFGEEPESYLHICLAQPDLFEYSQTALLTLFDDVTASFSGTIPTILVEINCYDVSRLLNDNAYRTMFSRICGPELFGAFIQSLVHGPLNVELHSQELTAWQIVWQPLQDYICKCTQQAQIFVIAEDAYWPATDANEAVRSPTHRSDNVVSLFGRR